VPQIAGSTVENLGQELREFDDTFAATLGQLASDDRQQMTDDMEGKRLA
jgi:hypothetical protein